MAATQALRINASSEPRSAPQAERKRKSTDSHEGNNDKRNPSVLSDKYIHVHHYLDTGRWGTWFNDPTLKRGSGKRRLYFGTYETEYLAARAQDRAALKFKPYAVRPITRLNFAESDYELDKDLRDNLTHEQFRRLLMAESRKCYRRAEPSPCWKIFLEEEAAKGNILVEYENRSNRFHREPRTFTEVLQEIVNKNEAVNIEETTEPINEPRTAVEEEGKVYTTKRTKRLTQSAPNQPAEEVTKELVAVDSAALSTRIVTARPVRKAPSVAARTPICLDAIARSLSARHVRKETSVAARTTICHDTGSLSARHLRKAISVAAPPVRHDSRSLSARQVRKAAPVAAPPIRHETRSASLSARPVCVGTPKAAPPARGDAEGASLSARQVRKAIPKAAAPGRRDSKSAGLIPPQVSEAAPKAAPKAAPAVLRRDTRHSRLSARPVPKEAPEGASQAAPRVRREPSTVKRGVRHAEGERRSALQAQQISDYLEHLEWGATKRRSSRPFSKLSLPRAASTDEATVATLAIVATVATVAVAEADSMNMIMAANILSVVPNGTAGTSGTSDGKVAPCSDHTAVENPSKRHRLSIDLNREPEPSSTASAMAPPHETDATDRNDDAEVSSVETLLLLKSGWLHEVAV